jgi:hypothetical protein
LSITVCHLPPGTSKWNKIEHRLFSFITKNWRGNHRLALGQRLAEIEPALLLAQASQCVPVRALNLLPHLLQRNRRGPLVVPRPTDWSWPQWGQRRSPRLASIAAVTAAPAGRPASTSSSSWRCAAISSSTAATGNDSFRFKASAAATKGRKDKARALPPA